MSHAGTIIGIPGLEIERVKRREGIEAHDGGVTQRKLSRTHRISPATVERWYQHHIDQRRSEMINRS